MLNKPGLKNEINPWFRHVALAVFLVAIVGGILVGIIIPRFRTVYVPYGTSLYVKDVISGDVHVITADGIELAVLSEAGEEDGRGGPFSRYLSGRLPSQKHQGCTLNLDTEWIDGKVYFTFTVTSITKFLLDVREKQFDAEYDLLFETNNSQAILAQPVKLTAMIQGRDETGTITSLTYHGSTKMTRRTYEHLTDWSFLYNWGETTGTKGAE